MKPADPAPSDPDQGALLPRDTRRSLPIALLRAREALMAHFRPLLAAHDLTEQQWRVIRVLGERGTLDASEVADRAFILAPSLTRIIRTLEERGLILRERGEADGRRVMLSLTAEGLRIIEEVAPESRQIYASLEARFGTAWITDLLDRLERLSEFNDGGGEA